MAADHNGFGPAGDKPGHVAADDGLTKDHTAQDIADRPIGGFPHLFQAKFFDAGLIGGDGGAFDGDAHLFGFFGRVDGDLIIGTIAFFHAQIVIEQVDIEIGQDQLVLDELPYDAGHFIAVHFNDGVFNLDLGHGASFRKGQLGWLVVA